MGGIICCALNVEIDPPKYTSKAKINRDGILIADFVDRRGKVWPAKFVGDASDLAANAIRLAEYLRLTDQERQELFAVLINWVERDESGKGLGL
jgi:hypothetical protein